MHSRKPSTAAGDHFEILMYIRRKPGTSREEFYKHWQLKHARLIAPWAEKHGVVSYKQVHTHGIVIPNNVGTASSEPIATTDLIQPVKYDGIVVWEVSNLTLFEAGFQEESYLKDIEPDEHKFMDKQGLGGGVVAKFQGKVWTMVEKGKAVHKNMEGDEMKVWDLLGKRLELSNMQDEAPYR